MNRAPTPSQPPDPGDRLLLTRGANWTSLGRYLERHYLTFDYARHRDHDPVRFVEPFRGGDPLAIEIVGLVASALAYGRVETILQNGGGALDRIGPDPVGYVRAFDPRRRAVDWRTFRHRFNDGRDLCFLLWATRRVIEEHGSLGALVSRTLRPAGDPMPGDPEEDLADPLATLIDALAGVDPRPVFGGRSKEIAASTRFLLASPAGGSTCKRLWMFARWMVRRPDALDGIDFGVWADIEPRRLLLPLDTHTARIAARIGLAGHRRTVGLAMARDVTANLRRFAPDDPVKYDFALAHLGISSRCRHRYDGEVCPRCSLEPVCSAGRPAGRD